MAHGSFLMARGMRCTVTPPAYQLTNALAHIRTHSQALPPYPLTRPPTLTQDLWVVSCSELLRRSLIRVVAVSHHRFQNRLISASVPHCITVYDIQHIDIQPDT